MILLRRTPASNPTLVHLIQTRSDADQLIRLARNAAFLGVDLEHHAAIPIASTPPSLELLAHRRLARPSSISPSQFSRAIAKAQRPSFALPRQIVQRTAWPSLQIALPPSNTDTPEERDVAGPADHQQPAECTHVFSIPLSTLSDEPWRLELIRTLFTGSEPSPCFIFHGAGNDLTVLRSRFKVAPPPSKVIDIQLMYNEWHGRKRRQREPIRRRLAALHEAPAVNPSLNDILAFLDLPTNPFKDKSRSTPADLVAYAAYDVDQLIPAFHRLQRLMLDSSMS